MGRFDFLPTPLEGLATVKRARFEDARGFLSRIYCAGEFREAHVERPFVQVNLTLTRRRGTVRGMHFQYPPHAEVKFVSCLRGEVFDVAVDLRTGSPTFLRWHGQAISAGNQLSMLIPEGFAHGFQALSDDCELLYLHTADYEPSSQGGISAVDPRVGITWPLDIVDVSDRDNAHPPIDASFAGIDV